jgi:hypothetical protein
MYEDRKEMFFVSNLHLDVVIWSRLLCNIITKRCYEVFCSRVSWYAVAGNAVRGLGAECCSTFCDRDSLQDKSKRWIWILDRIQGDMSSLKRPAKWVQFVHRFGRNPVCFFTPLCQRLSWGGKLLYIQYVTAAKVTFQRRFQL